MRRNIVCCAMVAAIVSTVAVAAAWCPEKGTDNKAAQSVSAETRCGGCIGQCNHPCDRASCDHRCTAKAGRVIRVADKANGAAKAGCNKPCGALGATTVADKAAGNTKAGCTKVGCTKAGCSEPCCAKGATTVADKAKTDSKAGCSKAYGAKGATTVADKAKSNSKSGCSKPCCDKGATVVADKGKGNSKSGCSKSYGAKGATAVADKAKSNSKSGCSKSYGAKGATAVADKGKGNSKSGCSKAYGAKSATAGSDCPIGLLLASMPQMRYRIGEDETCCGQAAESMAKKAGTSIAYLVGDKVHADKGAATVELTKLLEAEAGKLQGIQFVADGQTCACPMRAKDIARKAKTTVTYRVGGFDFADKAQAEKAVKLVADSVSKVRMTYRVDGVDYHCGKTASSKANGNGKKLTYVLGKESTGCDVSAGLLLAQAKIRAIVEAAATPAL